MKNLHELYKKLQKDRGINPEDHNPIVMILDNEKDKSSIEAYIKKEFGESYSLDLKKREELFLEVHRLANSDLEATILMEYKNNEDNYSAYFEAGNLSDARVREVLRNLDVDDKLQVHLRGNYQDIIKKLKLYFVVEYSKPLEKHERGNKYEEEGFLCIDIKILNRTGLHLRIAAMIAQVAMKYNSEIFLHYLDEKANAKSIMDLLLLGAVYDDRITIKAKGSDANNALDDLYGLFENRFFKNKR